VRGTILIIVTVVLKFPRHCPFVLLATIGLRQGRASGCCDAEIREYATYTALTE